MLAENDGIQLRKQNLVPHKVQTSNNLSRIFEGNHDQKLIEQK